MIQWGGGKLRGCIWEKCRGLTSWIRFWDASLSSLLDGVEACCRGSDDRSWSLVWEEGGRKYWLERRSNKAGRFLLCSVCDLEAKRFCLIFLEGKGLIGGWNILAEKLRETGVVPSGGLKDSLSLEVLRKEKKMEPRTFADVAKSKTDCGWVGEFLIQLWWETLPWFSQVVPMGRLLGEGVLADEDEAGEDHTSRAVETCWKRSFRPSGIDIEVVVGERSLVNRGQGVGGVNRLVSCGPVLVEALLQGSEREPRPFLLKGCLVGCEERPFLLKGSLVGCEELFRAMRESESLMVNVRAKITDEALVVEASRLDTVEGVGFQASLSVILAAGSSWVMETKGEKSLVKIGVGGEVERPALVELWDSLGEEEVWSPRFSRPFNDWEVEEVESALDSRSAIHFPNSIIWSPYVPTKVGFFAWEASWVRDTLLGWRGINLGKKRSKACSRTGVVVYVFSSDGIDKTSSHVTALLECGMMLKKK
ncbi:hypothetical protein CK203_078016 [Vitis vinifera]|uniref:Reverse transcriptase zinc-binding domain-containing protein n=1 Tax=Vitis vinifera TaxID=29760 RepID=A0A438DHE8_VITVI|nr:hypothetical protein CK203_078016 [Vitis vinifera]